MEAFFNRSFNEVESESVKFFNMKAATETTENTPKTFVLHVRYTLASISVELRHNMHFYKKD